MTFTEPMIATFDLSVGKSPLSIRSDRPILFYGYHADCSFFCNLLCLQIYSTLRLLSDINGHGTPFRVNGTDRFQTKTEDTMSSNIYRILLTVLSSLRTVGQQLTIIQLPGS